MWIRTKESRGVGGWRSIFSLLSIMCRIDRLLCASVREDAEAGGTDVHAGGILFKVACQQESYFHISDCELANYRLKMVIWAHGERIRQLCVSLLGSWTHYEQKYAFEVGGLYTPLRQPSCIMWHRISARREAWVWDWKRIMRSECGWILGHKFLTLSTSIIHTMKRIPFHSLLAEIFVTWQ